MTRTHPLVMHLHFRVLYCIQLVHLRLIFIVHVFIIQFIILNFIHNIFFKYLFCFKVLTTIFQAVNWIHIWITINFLFFSKPILLTIPHTTNSLPDIPIIRKCKFTQTIDHFRLRRCERCSLTVRGIIKTMNGGTNNTITTRAVVLLLIPVPVSVPYTFRVSVCLQSGFVHVDVSGSADCTPVLTRTDAGVVVVVTFRVLFVKDNIWIVGVNWTDAWVLVGVVFFVYFQI